MALTVDDKNTQANFDRKQELAAQEPPAASGVADGAAAAAVAAAEPAPLKDTMTPSEIHETVSSWQGSAAAPDIEADGPTNGEAQPSKFDAFKEKLSAVGRKTVDTMQSASDAVSAKIHGEESEQQTYEEGSFGGRFSSIETDPEKIEQNRQELHDYFKSIERQKAVFDMREEKLLEEHGLDTGGKYEYDRQLGVDRPLDPGEEDPVLSEQERDLLGAKRDAADSLSVMARTVDGKVYDAEGNVDTYDYGDVQGKLDAAMAKINELEGNQGVDQGGPEM